MCAVTDTDKLHVAMKELTCKAARKTASQVSVSLQTQKQKTRFGKPVNRGSNQPAFGPGRAGGFSLLNSGNKFSHDVLLTQYCAGGKIKKNEMGRACGVYGGGERCAQGFGGEA
jgi:hypothetical protein